uniref:CX domain-containing protein n=1 Tax=Parastrongyloides trichosuri TaxID=131310 RepID=A0A0N4ZA41_PARTI
MNNNGLSDVETTTEEASIDAVIENINSIAGEVNYLGNEGVNQIMDIVSNVESIVNQQKTNFEGVGKDAEEMIDVVTNKFTNWPVQAAIIVGIIGIIIIVLLILLLVIYTVYIFVSWLKLPSEKTVLEGSIKKERVKRSKEDGYGFIENNERQY